MQNYYDNYIESREFIERYEILDENIILYLGTGEIKKISFSEENLKEVITKMHLQAINGRKHIRKFIKRKMYFTKYIVNFSGIAAALIGFGLFLSPHIDIAVAFIILGIGTASLAGFMALLQRETSITINDIKKNEEFIKIEKEVDEVLKKYGKNLFMGTNKKTRELVLDDNFNLDLNSLEQIPLKDIYILEENMKRYKSYESETNEGRQFTLSPKSKKD